MTSTGTNIRKRKLTPTITKHDNKRKQHFQSVSRDDNKLKTSEIMNG